jgi:hypothetical protein
VSESLLYAQSRVTDYYSLIVTVYCSAFKWCLSAQGEKLEKKKLSYACLARVVREGGFKIALIARLSAVPGHCKSSSSGHDSAYILHMFDYR